MNYNLPKTVPLLPGHCFQDHLKESFRKTQQFSLVNGVHCEKTNFISEKDDLGLVDSLRMGTPPDLTYGSSNDKEIKSIFYKSLMCFVCLIILREGSDQ